MVWRNQDPPATNVLLDVNVPFPGGGSPAYLELDKLSDDSGNRLRGVRTVQRAGAPPRRRWVYSSWISDIEKIRRKVAFQTSAAAVDSVDDGQRKEVSGVQQ